MTDQSCPACGSPHALTRFVAEAFPVTFDGMQRVVGELSGCRCRTCGEVLFDAESARRYAAAGDALVLDA